MAGRYDKTVAITGTDSHDKQHGYCKHETRDKMRSFHLCFFNRMLDPISLLLFYYLTIQQCVVESDS